MKKYSDTLRTASALTAFILMLVVLISCGSRGGKTAKSSKVEPFPFPEVPAMMTDQSEIATYLATHYWNKFFRDPQKYYDEQKFQDIFVQYAQILVSVAPATIEQAQDYLLDKAERSQRSWPKGQMLTKVLDLQEKAFYDPNSPLRNEECCLPYLRKVASTEFCDDAAKQKAEYEIPLFSLNRIGTPAADFTYMLKTGRTGTLHAVKAKYTLLFFSNPGCHNCKEIIDALSADQNVQKMLDEGTLKVLNIYPDTDLTEWYNYMSHYPKDWISGYDPNNILHANTIYNIRAIPSIYMLDEQKRVLCKDAPLELALTYLR